MTRLPRTIVGIGLLGLMFVAGAFLSVSLPIVASGQEGEAEKALSLTTGEVQRLRQQAEEAKDLKEESKAKILEIYDKALAQLEAAEGWSEKAAAFDRVREEAPGATEALEEELRRDLPESKPKLPKDVSLDQLEQELMEVKLDQETANEQLIKL